MELMKNLRWICRVCTVNIKKRRSTQSAVSIFDTPELCEKLKRYLYIEIDPGDELPTKICGNCYKRIESFHNFALLANKTENFLKDFIKIARENILGGRSCDALNQKFQNQFESFAVLSSGQNKSSDEKDELLINNDDLPVNDAGELILNVSVNDPLMKDIENKIDLATKRRKLESERRKLRKTLPTTTTITSITNEVDKKNTQNKSRSLPDNLLKSNNSQNSVNNGAQSSSCQKISDGSCPSSFIFTENKKLSQLSQQQIQQDIYNRTASSTYDCLNLGSVIKDMDLLKLILKALKWPYTKETINAQIQKLKNTRLRDVITDPNLLQDTDMTQILRSYLSPVLLQSTAAAAASSSLSLPPHNNNSPFNANAMNSSAAAVAALNSLSSIVSYRIPADTSVQLISVPSTDAKSSNDFYHHDYYYGPRDHHNQQNFISSTSSSTKSKARRLSTASPIILSDDSNNNDDNGVQMFEVSVDPRLYFPGDKEFFFHQYNNTDSSMDNCYPNAPNKSPPSTSSSTAKIKTENSNPRTKVRKKQRKRDSRSNMNNNSKSKRKSQKQNQKQQQKQQQQQQEQQAQSQDVILIDDNTIETQALTAAHNKLPSQSQMKISSRKTSKPTVKSTIIQDDEGFKDFDIDSITLIEEASGDDEVWADFKVTESPEHSENGDHNNESGYGNIKKEIVHEGENVQNTSNTTQNENISINQDEIVTNQSKSILDNEEQSSSKITDKESINLNTNISIKQEQENCSETIKKKTPGRKSKKATTASTTSARITRPKSPRTYFNKRKQKNKKDKTQSPKSQTEKKQQQQQKTIEKEVAPSSRKSNARKRICKQCGLTFTNIIDFVEHRKEHM